MTIRPSGKARKRTRTEPVGGQVDDPWAGQAELSVEEQEQIEAQLRVAEERLEHSQRTLLDNLQSGARRIIEAKDEMPAAVVEDAGEVIIRIIMLRDYEQRGCVRDAWLNHRPQEPQDWIPTPPSRRADRRCPQRRYWRHCPDIESTQNWLDNSILGTRPC